MKFNIEDYLPLLEDVDMSQSQKETMAYAVWEYMGARVDQHFGLHPVQACSTPLSKQSQKGKVVPLFQNRAANDDQEPVIQQQKGRN